MPPHRDRLTHRKVLVLGGARSGKSLFAERLALECGGPVLYVATAEALDELVPRLEARGTEAPEERSIRLATAEREMQRLSEYDYVIVNHRDRQDQALDDLKAIIRGERLRVCRRTVTI